MSARALLVLARRSLVNAVRRPVVLTFSFVQPALWMVLFGPMMSRAVATAHSDGYITFVAPGIVGLTLLFGASQIGVSLVKDAQSGMLARMVGSNTGTSALLFGKLLGDTLRLLAQGSVVLLIGMLAGAKFTFTPSHLPLMLLCALGLVVTVGSVSTSIACATRQPEMMGTFVHLANIPLLFTSSALVDIRAMPQPLGVVAELNPVSIFAEAARAGLLDAAPPSGARIALLIVLALACFITATKLYSRAGVQPDR